MHAAAQMGMLFARGRLYMGCKGSRDLFPGHERSASLPFGSGQGKPMAHGKLSSGEHAPLT